MRKFKGLFAVLMAMVMMFAFASTAMAAEAPTLTVVANGQVLANAVTVNVGDSVYNAVDSWAKANGYAIDWTGVTSELGGTGMVLKSLDGNASVPYETNALDDYDDEYTPECGNEVLARVNAALLAKYPDSDGLGLWIGNGTGFSKEGPYMAYVGDDWTFTVNGSRPANAAGVELYMNQTIIEADDEIVLTYGEVIEVWNY